MPFIAKKKNTQIFRCLSEVNILALFRSLLNERKIILVSKYPSLLVSTSETMLSLLFPFHFQGVYMPVLPQKLIDFLHSPVPYLAGIHPDWMKGVHLPDDVCFF